MMFILISADDHIKYMVSTHLVHLIVICHVCMQIILTGPCLSPICGDLVSGYLEICKGYLFRIGGVAEWSTAKEVVNYTIASDHATFLVSTTDSKGRMMLVHLQSLSPRQLEVDISIVLRKRTGMYMWILLFCKRIIQ